MIFVDRNNYLSTFYLSGIKMALLLFEGIYAIILYETERSMENFYS